ncbi:1259_t:CDS:2 [Funneliformis caledonium]|uniref:1259_t:CDS:1 n=1 Tax=Funneliformis caledonium TaxID=1117310 RepID=A0A9N8VJ96_9GLOM|nr:1259_t:CDS:2 [Funneliformis caledonium]
MRNEYVVTLLHAGIHIVIDITNKDFSMKPQYGIISEESQGQVNYAIKDKQHKVP